LIIGTTLIFYCLWLGWSWSYGSWIYNLLHVQSCSTYHH